MLHSQQSSTHASNRKGPIKQDARLWCLTIRGGHLKVTSTEFEYDNIEGKGRGDIRGFSKASRKRMLQMIDEIDWMANGPGVFLTLTLPDQRWRAVRNMLTHIRHRFFRDSEKHLGKQLYGLWRIEWKPRLTGNAVGQLRPHWHFLFPGLRWYDQQDAMVIWQKILKYRRPISVTAERMDSHKKVAVYIAKYCAKETPLSHLDSVAYLNSKGRHWGIRRKALITMHPRRDYVDLPQEAVSEIRKLREASGQHYSSLYDGGFSLFGPWSADMKKAIEKIALDHGCIVDYPE